MKKWTCEYEINYWDTVSDDECKHKIKKKYDYFKVEEIILKYFNGTPNVAIDIAGGMWGGALQFFNAKHKILVDYLADKFKNEGKLPKDVEIFNNTFCNLPFENNSVDVIFCWEALDHCNNITEFKTAQKEILRVLSKGGILFFEMPMRKSQINGHLISIQQINHDELINGFSGLQILQRIDKAQSFGSPNPFILIMQKEI